MDSSVSLKDEIWFLRVCHHIWNAVYFHNNRRKKCQRSEYCACFGDLSHIIHAVCCIHAYLLNIWCLCVSFVRQGDISVDRHKYTLSYWLFVVMKLLTSSVTFARIAVWQISLFTQEPSSTVLPVQGIRHIARWFGQGLRKRLGQRVLT
jgi:hypothetical protein